MKLLCRLLKDFMTFCLQTASPNLNANICALT